MDKLFCVSIIACFIILLAVTEPAAVQQVDDTVLKADGKHVHYTMYISNCKVLQLELHVVN